MFGQGSSDVLHFKHPPDKMKLGVARPPPVEVDLTEEELVFRSDQEGSRFTPANLNPRQSGATLTKIIEGKYSKVSKYQPEASSATKKQEISQVPASRKRPSQEKLASSTSRRKVAQEGNLFGKMIHHDPSQVKNHGAMDPSAVHQEHNLDRKIDLPPLPPSSSQDQVLEPSVPNPFENVSWLSEEIEMLLKKKSRMTNSLFRFEVNPEAASSNFKKLAENDFNLEKLLNPAERCATSYGSEFKEVGELEGLLSKHPRWKDLK